MPETSFLSPSLLAALARHPTLAALPHRPVQIRLHEPQPRPDDPRRLNLFAGRALGEREFERLQAYVDDRVRPLLAGLPPGIVEGLLWQHDGSGAGTRLRVQPGLAVGAQGQLIRLFHPLVQTWTDLADQAERDQDRPLRDGLFLLTIRSAVQAIDDDSGAEPCTRDEPDPLRDRRIETVCLLGLQRISGSPTLMALPQARAANRISARLLSTAPFQADSGAVPLGLIKVVDRLPQWFDPIAGRLMAEPGAAARSLLAHTVAAMEAWQKANPGPLPDEASQTLADLLGLDFLPAAGPLPAGLLRDPAGTPPKLAFLPADLRIDLVPVPASTVASVVATELQRGTVDLIHGIGDPLRLLLAIPDLDYRRNLFDLPQRDTDLEDELFRRSMAAQRAYQAWMAQWFNLFHGLSDSQLVDLRAPKRIGTPPESPLAYRDRLVEIRRSSSSLKPLKPDGDTADDAQPQLPEPYLSHNLEPSPPPQDYQAPIGAEPGGDGLFLQREQMRADIRHLEAALDQSYRLLEEVNDFLGLQRQQLDALTVSFSTLAGGVAGDGLGAKLVRWTTKANFKPSA